MRSTVTALALLLGAAALAAQAPAGRQPQVTFRVEVNFVEIDAVVTDAQGRFVRELRKDEFEVLEDGVAQTIAAFTPVDLPVERADPPLPRTTPVPADVRSSVQPFNGRVIVVVLDDLHVDFRRTPLVRAAARRFVTRYVGANDLVAVVHTGLGQAAGQDFTSTPERLLAAIDRFSGRASRDASAGERAHHATSTLRTLREASRFLAGIHGRRKAIVWFSEGTDHLTDNPMSARNALSTMADMRDAIAAATRSGVSFYAFDPRGLGAGLDSGLSTDVTSWDGVTPDMARSFAEARRTQDFLRTMSEETGGFAAVDQNNLNDAFARVIRENSSYYLLGYYPANERRDGKFRKVEVRVRRPGVHVRSRAGYTAPKGRDAAAAGLARATGASPEVREALDSPVPVSGLGFHVFAAPFLGPSRKAAVAITIEFDPGRLSFVESGGVYTEELEIVVLPVDASGKPHEGARDMVPMKLSRRSHDLVRTHGLRIARLLDLAPGRYQLRVAARAQNAKAVGSVTYDLDVPDFGKAPLALSGLTLASAAAAQVPTPPPGGGFMELLREVPSTRREFDRADTLALFAEVYDNRMATPHRIAIATTVVAEDGRVVVNTSDERNTAELQEGTARGRSGGFGHSVKIPLAGLAPGRYVARVEARALVGDTPSASRELEFRVR